MEWAAVRSCVCAAGKHWIVASPRCPGSPVFRNLGIGTAALAHLQHALSQERSGFLQRAVFRASHLCAPARDNGVPVSHGRTPGVVAALLFGGSATDTRYRAFDPGPAWASRLGD